MALDERYILMQDPESFFINKDSGLPLANGFVYSYRDDARNTPKALYQLTGTPGSYTYTALPNPLPLSGVGTPQNAGGDNVAVYYLPYRTNPATGEEEIDLYYLSVKSSAAVEQFTRSAWPNLVGGNDPTQNPSFINNELSNAQFSEVLITPSTTTTFTVAAATAQVFEVAPDWDMIISGTGTVIVEQIPLSGNDDITTHPAFALEITTSAGITECRLNQRMNNNSGLWADTYLAGSFVAKRVGGASAGLSMYYAESTPTTSTLIASAALTTEFVRYAPTPVITPSSTNTQDSDSGYIDIYLALSPSTTIQVTSVQIAPTQEGNILPYDTRSSNRELAMMSDYYTPRIADKPIPSYLTAWNFPLNPSQFFANGAVTLGATGANKSSYIWDQTIAFQTVNNVLASARNSASNALDITVTSASSFALVQYLEAKVAREILAQRNSIKLRANVSSATLAGTVSLWWTADGSLPDIKSPNYNSLVSSITAGVPTAGNGTWTQVTRSGLPVSAPFTLTTSTAEWDFTGFDATAGAGGTTATFVAVVIAFNTLAIGQTAVVDYCTLVAGDIPTQPAPQTPDDVLRECQYYYEKSYNVNVTPGTNSTSGERFAQQANNPMTGSTANTAQNLIARVFGIQYRTEKRATPTLAAGTLVFYTPAGTVSNVLGTVRNGGAALATADIPITNWGIEGSGEKSVQFLPANVSNLVTSGAAVGNQAESFISYQYVVDVRLGVV